MSKSLKEKIKKFGLDENEVSEMIMNKFIVLKEDHEKEMKELKEFSK